MPKFYALLRTVGVVALVVMLSLLDAAAVQADYIGPYLQFQAGGYLPDVAKADDPQGTFNLEFDTGYVAGVAVGYELDPTKGLGQGRVEVAYSYLSTSVDKVEFADGKIPSTGDLTLQTLLCNVWGVYRNTSRWTPYYGGGLGLGWVQVDELKVSGQLLSDDDAYGLAYQLGLGVDYALQDQFWLDMGYRFQGVWDVDFAETGGSSFSANIHGHSLVLGLRIGF